MEILQRLFASNTIYTLVYKTRCVVKKVLLVLFWLVLLCVGAAAFYLWNADWIGNHRDKISEQFYNATGKVIKFEGDITFKFFPVPYLQANNVKIYNNKEMMDVPLAEINNLAAKLELKPLFAGEFNITSMEVSGIKFMIDWDNGFNWQSDLSADQKQVMAENEISLNSVQIKDAEFYFESAQNNIKFHLTNLNGELSAESMLGPFRMEGNYINGNTPEGFALTIGRLSDISATSLNLAVTHPSSNSYVRFDGSFQVTNKVINGNVILETADISKFANANFTKFKIPNEYNKKTALGFDLSLNPQEILLSNIVVKYGENTSGSGNIKIPSSENNETDDNKITASFNFTDFDLDNFEQTIVDFVKQNNDKIKLPNLKLESEFRALRVNYKGQQLKDMNVSVSCTEKGIFIKNSEVLLPGNTSLYVDAELFVLDELLHYRGDVSVRTDNLIQTLRWLDIEPNQLVQSVYKNLVFSGSFSGNMERMQISPFELTLDKITSKGEAGFVWKDRKDVMIKAKFDTINFDNYVSPLPDEERQKNWPERVAYRFKKFGVLNEFDLVLDVGADLIIYESMPFEKVVIKGNILNQVADIENFSIDKLANTKISLKGKLKGFGDNPYLEAISYNIKSDDVTSLINKLELKVPSLDYKKFNELTMVGNINGDINNCGVNTIVNLGSLDAEYAGKIVNTVDGVSFDGDLLLKHPNFNQLVKNLQLKYEPVNDNLGGLQLKTKIKKQQKKWLFDEMEVNIGKTNILGTVDYEQSENNNIAAKLQINKIDVQNFMQKEKSNLPAIAEENKEQSSFLSKPLMLRDTLNYDFYKNANVKADVSTEAFLWKDFLIKNAKFNLEILDGVAQIKNLEGLYNNASLKSDVVLDMNDDAKISLIGSIENANINDFSLKGNVYGLTDGVFSSSWDVSSSAVSVADFWNNIKGKADFKASEVTVNGIDISSIYNDLTKRIKVDGLSGVLRKFLTQGSTKFAQLGGYINIDKSMFTLTEALLLNDDAEFKVKAEGNLGNWSLDSAFEVQFKKAEYLPKFVFVLKDTLDNPSLDVNVVNLENFYKSKEDQRIAEKEKIKKQEEDRLRNRWLLIKKSADKLVTDTRSTLEKEIDEKIDKVKSNKSKDQYMLLKQDLANLLASLVEKINTTGEKQLLDKELLNLSELQAATQKEISVIESKMEEIYNNDVKEQLALYDKKSLEIKNQLKQLSFSYNGMIEKHKEKLAHAEIGFYMSDDAIFQNQKTEIEQSISSLNELSNKMVQIKGDIQNSNFKNFDIASQEIENIIKEIQKERENITNKIEEINKKDEVIFEQALLTYQEKKAEERDKKLLQDNIGKIVVKKNGQVVNISRDLEEIKTAKDQIAKEGLRVLDFTKPKVNVAEPVKDGVVKKGRNIIAN